MTADRIGPAWRGVRSCHRRRSGARTVQELAGTRYQTIELKVHDVEGSDRRLAAYRDRKPIWARTLANFGGSHSLNNLEFLGDRVEALGLYGFRVAMIDGRSMSVYLDSEGNFLFYMLSF